MKFSKLLIFFISILFHKAYAGVWSLPTPPSNAPAKLIPYPQKVEWKQGTTTLKSCSLKVHGLSKNELKTVVPEIKGILTENGFQLKKRGELPLVLRKSTIEDALVQDEAYSLTVRSNHIELKASTANGLFNGLQTFRQLISSRKKRIPHCRITDWPSFKIRGFMHDLGRYYQTPEFLKKQLETLSRYKINTFHMHLTDDPAWRVEVKKYPQLTAKENHWPTRVPGKFYTQDEIKDIVEFCQKRHIEIIPEIDMPGHSKSFTKAIGHNMQTPEGMKVLQESLAEIIPLFPGSYFHIGSDEVSIKMKEFMPEMVKFVRSFGKEVIVWSPGLLPDREAVNMHWGQHEGHKVNKTMKHIDTHGFYMDWIDSQSGVYQFFFQQPCDTPQGSDLALGAVTPVWADGALSHEKRVLEQYPFYPCMVTFAERSWRGAKEKRVDLMAKLPQPGTDAYKAFAEFEDRLSKHRDLCFRNQPFAYVKQSHIPWRLIGPFDHKGKNDTSFEPERMIKNKYKDGSKVLSWMDKPAWGGAIHLRHFYDMFNMHYKRYRINHWPATMTDEVGKDGGTCYALTYIHSKKSLNTHLMFGIGGMWGHTGGYRSAMAPAQGEWDFSGGDIWLNNNRVEPPKWMFESLPWTGWGRGRIENAPLTEEGYFFRPAVKIRLKAGWNKVLIRIPFGWWKGDKGQRKWFFNCIPVSWDGEHCREVKGLKYAISPRK